MNLKNFPKRLDSKTSCLRISVPENLDLALEGLIRKVLREQPKTDDIYTFAADYFETLLKIRDKTGPKFTASQLCPFHNDEDAHEMIKLAGTFAKPVSQPMTAEKKPTTKKTEKPVEHKQPTPDLIRKLPKPQAKAGKIRKRKNPTGRTESKPEKQESQEEFLTSDPIKELVERELMLEASKDKTDEKEKTEAPAKEAQNGEKPLQPAAKDVETSEDIAKNEKQTEIKDETETPGEKENEKAPMEEAKNKEITDSSKVETEESVKEPEATTKSEETKEEANKEVTKQVGEVQKSTEDQKEDEKIQEKVKDSTEKAPPEDKKEEPTQKTNRIMETFPVTETVRRVSDVLTDKLPEITEETAEKDKEEFIPNEKQDDSSAADQKQVGTPITAEGKPEKPKVGENIQPNEQQVKNLETIPETEPKPEEKETKDDQEPTESTSVSLEKPVEVSPVDKDAQKTEEPIQVEPTSETHTRNQETEEKEKKEESTEEKKTKSESSNLAEEPKETPKTVDEPKSDESIRKSLDSTFGEIIQDTEEEMKKEDVKPKDEETPKDKTTRQETVTEEGKTIPAETAKEDESTGETTTEDIKQATADVEKSTEIQNEENKPKDSTSESETKENEAKVETEEKKQSESQEGETADETVTVQTQKPQAENQLVKEEPKTEAEEGIKEEETGEELCSVVDIEQIQRVTEREKQEGEPEAEKPEGNIQTDKTETELSQTKDKTDENEPELSQIKKEKTDSEELCTVVDIQQIPKQEETDGEKSEELPKTENVQTAEAEELCTVADTQNLPKEDEQKEEKLETEKAQNPEEEHKAHLGEVQETPAEDKTQGEKSKEGNSESKPEAVDTQQEESKQETANTEHIIRVEEVENPERIQSPEEIQIKTIQTHYYDTLQVPETVTKEYRVHNIAPPAAAGLLGVASAVYSVMDENMNTPSRTEHLESPETEEKDSQPTETAKPEFQPPIDRIKTDSPPASPNLDVEAETQRTDSDDLLDLMTPSSGYSLNLSELSWVTVSEFFLDSEKRHSSREKEPTRYVAPKTGEKTTEEVEEIIEKTVLPSGIEAVPVPPREADEINAETNTQPVEAVKDEEKKEEDRPENDSSSNGRSVDSDIPFISVEVKTVIETQILDDDDDDGKNGEQQPDLEVKVQATIDIPDEGGTSQAKAAGVEMQMSDGKSQESKPALEGFQTGNQDEETQGSCSTDQTTGKEGSSVESDQTASSAATEIKRSDSAKRNLSSGRSLVSTQSLDLGKRNPLLKTRSLSTFRHGVTDFEIWSQIEKELEDAAIKIQSKFRGYKTRKKLRRENAVQITTEESSVSTTPVEPEPRDECQQSTGEFHDSIILSEHPR